MKTAVDIALSRLAKADKALRDIRQKLYEAYHAVPEREFTKPTMVVEYADIVAIDAALDS